METSKHENDAEIRRITDAYARREERGDPRFARAIRRERETIYRRMLETSATAAIDALPDGLHVALCGARIIRR